ncbi:hypothetical protein EII17_14360 [Clostridiales bacterium COT073_COT-073]|nr:hypothetical protein EII17_14360 [Clostridiales bacterium COT073_COT-073]
MAQVDNAIILAAGMGSRFVPITYNRPKGLVVVHGESLVERQIRQLLAVGIDEILIVTGYMAEAFAELEKKYDGIVRCLYNPHYKSQNNISSLYLVRNHLKNSYILSSDNYYTQNIFRRIEENSWYCAITDTKPRCEWGLETDDQGRVIKVAKIAEANQPFMYGAVYFNHLFSAKFRQILEKAYENPDNHQYLWEEILSRHLPELEIYIRMESPETVYELESFEELREFDAAYQQISGNSQLALIARLFSVPESEISQIMPQKMGLTNDSFLFNVRGQRYVFRLPGKGSQQFIDRRKEAFVYENLRAKDITDRVIYFEPESGIKITAYEEDSHILDFFRDKEQLKKAVAALKQVHQSGIVVEEEFALTSCRRYEQLNQDNPEFFPGYYWAKAQMIELMQYLSEQGVKPTFCYCDFVMENILCLKDGNVRLIDWEYSAMGEAMADLAVFITTARLGETELKELAELYFGGPLSRLQQIQVYVGMVIAAVTWGAWAKHKEYEGYYFQEPNYPENYFAYAGAYIEKARALIGGSDEL